MKQKAVHHNMWGVFGLHVSGEGLRFYLLVLVLRQKLVKV
jgi:hypothetical protein